MTKVRDLANLIAAGDPLADALENPEEVEDAELVN